MSDEFRERVDEGVGEVFSEDRFSDFIQKYGIPTVFVAKNAPWGQGSGNYLGQYLKEWGNQIVIYENGWTSINDIGDTAGWVDREVYQAMDSQGRMQIKVGSGMKHTIRHEYGHHLQEVITADQRTQWRDLYFDSLGRIEADGPLAGGMLGKDEDVQFKWAMKEGLGGQFPSVYGMVNTREGFAETFSAVSDPEYDRDAYVEDLHPLLEFMEGLA